MTVHALPERAGARSLNEREAAPSVLTLAVENMRCGGCIRSVERAAMSVPGVVGARVRGTGLNAAGGGSPGGCIPVRAGRSPGGDDGNRTRAISLGS